MTKSTNTWNPMDFGYAGWDPVKQYAYAPEDPTNNVTHLFPTEDIVHAHNETLAKRDLRSLQQQEIGTKNTVWVRFKNSVPTGVFLYTCQRIDAFLYYEACEWRSDETYLVIFRLHANQGGNTFLGYAESNIAIHQQRDHMVIMDVKRIM